VSVRLSESRRSRDSTVAPYVQASVGLKPPHEIEVVVEEAANMRETQAHGQQVRRARRPAAGGCAA